MKECQKCELATYCYSEANTWVFRTKQEMREKQAAIAACPIHDKKQSSRSPHSQQE